MEENRNYQYPEEEEGLDIIALVKSLWDGRKTIIICTCVFIVLGLFAAITMKRTYTVSSVMVPQVGSRSNSSLSSLASLAGFDIGATNLSSSDLSPLVYPQIVNSVPYRLELLYTPLHFEKADTAVSIYTYAKEYAKPSVMSKVMKYTIGLPFTILNALRKEKPETDIVVSKEGDNSPKPLVLTKDEDKLIKSIAHSVSLAVDKKEGYLTLTVIGSEPVMTAELALKAQQLLQTEVTRFRTEKAKQQLDYVQARYNEIKAETEAYQTQLATVRDRSKNMPTSRSLIEQERIQTKYTVSSSIYAEMAKQLEQVKMQVKRDTPVLAVIQPITVPRQPSNSRAKTLFVWTFFGVILGCGIVLGKEYLPKVKAMFKKEEEEKAA